MDTVKINKGNVKIIAHRGLSGLEKENTYPAFVAAGNRSYFGVETDVHKTKDGKFVIIHDETTQRISLETVNINVEESNYDDVKDIVLPDVDSSFGRNDIRIPLLRDYINICKKYDKKCVLELKNTFLKEDIITMIDEINELGYIDNMIFISFSKENCINLRSLLPESTIQWLVGREIEEEEFNMLREYRFDLDVRYTVVDKYLVDKIHSIGQKINCWTCDNKDEAEALCKIGVDYITTNILE